MASYPGAVKSFTTKADGDDIEAAHIDDLQDEVVAVQTGLLAGIAHILKPLVSATLDLGTSIAQWRDLWLSRNASIGGTLGVTGMTTLADALKAADGTVSLPSLSFSADTNTGIYRSANDTLDFATAGTRAMSIGATGAISSATQHRCRVYHSTTQSIPDNTSTALLFNSEDYDVGGLHDTGSNTSRLTAVVDGLYDVKGLAYFASNTTGYREVLIRKNGSTFYSQAIQAPVTGIATAIPTAAELALVAGDYVELVVVQTSGGALNGGSSDN